MNPSPSRETSSFIPHVSVSQAQNSAVSPVYPAGNDTSLKASLVGPADTKSHRDSELRISAATSNWNDRWSQYQRTNVPDQHKTQSFDQYPGEPPVKSVGVPRYSSTNMIVEDVGIPTEANLLPDNPDDRRRKPGRRSNADAKIKHTVKAKKSTGYSPKTSIESRGSVNLPTQSKVDGGATLLQSWINNDQINIGSPRTTHHQNSMIEPQIAFASSHPQSPIHLSHVQPPAVLYESLSAAENEYKAKVAAIESLAARKTTKRHRDRTEQTIPISPAVITLLKQQLVALTIASKEQSMHIATLEQELSVANEREIKILTTFEAWKNEANQNLEAARTEIKALKAKFAEKESGTAKSFKSQIRDLELELYREQLKSQGLESKVRNLELTLAQEREDRNKDQQYGAADHVKALVRELDVLQDAARKAEARDGENEHLTRMWRVASEQVDSTKNKLDGLYEKLKESLDKAKSSPRSEIA